jgi:taurine dioxygenase
MPALLGAEVVGLDLSQPLGQGTIARLRAAFLKRSVLLWRGQDLSKSRQVDLCRLFGEPVPHPTNTRDRDEEVPEICIIANVQENGRAVGALANDEVAFHADLVFLHEPGAVSMLYCLETPAAGGDTWWTSGYAAYAALDQAIKARLEGLKAVYRHRRPEYNPPVAAAHPLVCTHPESGRRTLFVSPGAARGIEGMEEGQSRELLDLLAAHAIEDRFAWRHHWQPGDLVVWDNRCTLHRRETFDARERRYMRRVQTLGKPHISNRQSKP